MKYLYKTEDEASISKYAFSMNKAVAQQYSYGPCSRSFWALEFKAQPEAITV